VVGMRIRAAWTEGTFDFMGVLEVPPGTIGIVKDHSRSSMSMSTKDTDDESDSDDDKIDVGVLSVKWNSQEVRSIYDCLDHFVIDSC